MEGSETSREKFPMKVVFSPVFPAVLGVGTTSRVGHQRVRPLGYNLFPRFTTNFR